MSVPRAGTVPGFLHLDLRTLTLQPGELFARVTGGNVPASVPAFPDGTLQQSSPLPLLPPNRFPPATAEGASSPAARAPSSSSAPALPAPSRPCFI
ncbi:hypothetical protein EGK_05413 [Macaca mulatta]|uniref:Uncharacterized protein n=1 Tax=Macaca mulatta TaxID=9544 RepID=G7NA93_MACMU|nr:hypothetical protein EGK_05413 [Macaca mulatta]